MSKKFTKVDQILSSLKISDNEKSVIYKHLAAILHLGEIQFETNAGDSDSGAKVTKSTENHVNIASELINSKPQELLKAIQFGIIRVPGSTIT